MAFHLEMGMPVDTLNATVCETDLRCGTALLKMRINERLDSWRRLRPFDHQYQEDQQGPHDQSRRFFSAKGNFAPLNQQIPHQSQLFHV